MSEGDYTPINEEEFFKGCDPWKNYLFWGSKEKVQEDTERYLATPVDWSEVHRRHNVLLPGVGQDEEEDASRTIDPRDLVLRNPTTGPAQSRSANPANIWGSNPASVPTSSHSVARASRAKTRRPSSASCPALTWFEEPGSSSPVQRTSHPGPAPSSLVPALRRPVQPGSFLIQSASHPGPPHSSSVPALRRSVQPGSFLTPSAHRPGPNHFATPAPVTSQKSRDGSLRVSKLTSTDVGLC